MIRFRPGISILGAFLVAILLFPFWPSWHAGARPADEPRAFHVEGDVVKAQDPSIIKDGDTWYLFTTTPPDSKTPDQFPIPRMPLICCLRISTETRNCSYKGDRDDKPA